MANHIKQEIIEELHSMGHVMLNELMNKYTFFKTGGPADLLIFPKGMDTIKNISSLLKEHSVPLTTIGGGSNLLIGDKGLRGAVLRLGNDGIMQGEIELQKNGELFTDSLVSKE